MASRFTAISRYGLPCTREGATPIAPGISRTTRSTSKAFCLQRVEIVAEDLHADLRADAGAEHEDAVLDRLEKAGHVAGHLRELCGQLGDELVLRHARAPLALAA